MVDASHCIVVEDVSYAYPGGGSLALADVSLSVATGEFACILGPSGCGKSTLLNILSGLAAPQSGRVTVDGDVLYEGGRSTQQTSSMRCSFVFQESRLLPWRTVRQNIHIAMEAAGFPRDTWNDAVERYLDILRLGEFADAWPNNLSGGQRQRAAIARALAIDPAFILMDEPFSTLDEVTARFLRSELLEIWRESGKTIMFVTHSIREAVYLADRIFMMTKGPGSIFAVEGIGMGRPRRYEDPKLAEIEASMTETLLERWGYHEEMKRAAVTRGEESTNRDSLVGRRPS